MDGLSLLYGIVVGVVLPPVSALLIRKIQEVK